MCKTMLSELRAYFIASPCAFVYWGRKITFKMKFMNCENITFTPIIIPNVFCQGLLTLDVLSVLQCYMPQCVHYFGLYHWSVMPCLAILDLRPVSLSSGHPKWEPILLHLSDSFTVYLTWKGRLPISFFSPEGKRIPRNCFGFIC